MDLSQIQSLAEAAGVAAGVCVVAFAAAVRQLGQMRRSIEGAAKGAAARHERGAQNVVQRLLGASYESLADSDPEGEEGRPDEQSGAIKTLLREVVEESNSGLEARLDARLDEIRREVHDVRADVQMLRRGQDAIEARVNEHSDEFAIAKEQAAGQSLIDGAIPRESPA